MAKESITWRESKKSNLDKSLGEIQKLWWCLPRVLMSLCMITTFGKCNAYAYFAKLSFISISL